MQHMFITIPADQYRIAQMVANNLSLHFDTIYGTDPLTIAARQQGVRGNHEPRWTAAERLLFIRRFNDALHA